jgi:hypothetical protein
MLPEERKQYNKQYYAENKERILCDLCTKVQCELCGRTVIKNNINKHYTTQLCMKTQERNEIIKLRMQ